jgi:hypothetical protein
MPALVTGLFVRKMRDSALGIGFAFPALPGDAAREDSPVG